MEKKNTWKEIDLKEAFVLLDEGKTEVYAVREKLLESIFFVGDGDLRWKDTSKPVGMTRGRIDGGFWIMEALVTYTFVCTSITCAGNTCRSEFPCTVTRYTKKEDRLALPFHCLYACNCTVNWKQIKGENNEKENCMERDWT